MMHTGTPDACAHQAVPFLSYVPIQMSQVNLLGEITHVCHHWYSRRKSSCLQPKF